MERLIVSEFADEYQDWLGDDQAQRRAGWLDLPIGDLGRNHVLTVSPTDAVHEVVRAMCSRGCGAVLVADAGELVGIFTERDLSSRVVCEGRDVELTEVRDVMTRRPEVLMENDTLGQALRMLVIGGYRHVPVIDELGCATNVVSVRRIMEHVAELFPEQVFNAPLDSQPPPVPRADGG